MNLSEATQPKNLYHFCRYIKLSSPKLNNVAVIGCIFVYLAVIVLGMDDLTLEAEYFIVCSVSYSSQAIILS